METFPRNWPFVRGIHRSPMNSPHKAHWRGALMFSLICVWINDWVNNREAGDLRRYRAHCDVSVMWLRLYHSLDRMKLLLKWDTVRVELWFTKPAFHPPLVIILLHQSHIAPGPYPTMQNFATEMCARSHNCVGMRIFKRIDYLECV